MPKVAEFYPFHNKRWSIAIPFLTGSTGQRAQPANPQMATPLSGERCVLKSILPLKDRTFIRTGNHLRIAGQVAGFNLGLKFRQRIKSLADLFIG